MPSRVALSFLLAGVCGTWALAQVPAGPEFQVNTITTGVQQEPSIASDSSGNFVVAWEDNWNISARRYDQAGTPIGDEFQVFTGTTWNPRAVRPSVASDPGGRFIVAWEEEWGDAHISRFPFRVYDAAGIPVASGTVGGDLRGKGVAADGAGNFVIVWSRRAGDLYPFDVYAQRFDSSGVPRGAEFLVSAGTDLSFAPIVASDVVGNFVIIWYHEGDDSLRGRRYDSLGEPRGSEFALATRVHNVDPTVAMDTAGGFVVAWMAWNPSSTADVFAQRFNPDGTPVGQEFRVNLHDGAGRPAVASDATGNFVVTWRGGDGDGAAVFARRFEATGAPRGTEFRVVSYTTEWPVSRVTADPDGDFVVTWYGADNNGRGDGIFAQRFGNLEPAALAVDTSSTETSDGNQVFEPGESIDVRPGYRNLNGRLQTLSFSGSAAFSGPSGNGVVYSLQDGAGAYGPIANGDTASCFDCYRVGVSAPPARPALHWDATLAEGLALDPPGQKQTWKVHVGQSFADVPKTSPTYRFIETLLHVGVTSGCSANAYCPTGPVSREQMAAFAVTGKEGPGYSPPACNWPVFDDVPLSSPFCPFIQQLAWRRVVTGCGGGNYCPGSPVTRDQMAVFLLATLDPAIRPPACTTPLFGDVPASSPFCRYIEELARRGIASGCGGGNYCPASVATREQMAVFVTVTFGLSLYGP